ncbi:MAG: gamma-glutamyltransferase [Thermoleophilia bacterium]|nr:gamma-glutamyltransferase [Thermoleophilia bacterium]
MPISPGAAAGHPATAEAAAEILEDGGTAADAAVAACLASCVAEVVMTGLAGGGHAIWVDGTTGRTSLLDFFVAVPGLGREPGEVELVELAVPFGTELVHYAVGIGSCAVPGVPAGLDELWRHRGRLPWARLCEPGRRLASEGVALPPAHAACLAMLSPVLTLREGSALFLRAGRLLAAGDRLVQPGLARALELLAEEGARSFYEGTLGEALLALMEERGGQVTSADMSAYRASWSEPVEARYCGRRLATRGGLAGLVPTLAAVPPLAGRTSGAQAVALARALLGPDGSGHTTNLCVVDGDGNACALTTSLGLGSGDYLRGFDLHLNSMLGEADLLVGNLEPGARMESMMAPLALFGDDGLEAVAGAAGGTRLRSALVQVLARVVDLGLDAQTAVDEARLHPVARPDAGPLVHVEPGWEPDALAALEDAGFELRRWPERHHYFGGVSVLARSGGAADPRRSGAVVAAR